jgi:Tfp pilus assembly protein PilF
MIKTMDALRKYDAAVDQYIEIINLYPEEADRLRTAMEYAEQHGLAQRIVAYYEKLSRESNKNFRWQLVLGSIYERQGNLAGAADQYRVAVVNEPQRPDLRFNLASVFTRQRRYDEAIAVLREGWTLSGRDPQWLMEIAQIQARQGQRDEAIKTVRQALTSKQNANTEAKLMIASTLASWGLNDEAVRVYEETFNALPRTLKDEYVNTTQIASYVRALVRTEPVARAYQKVERMRGVFQAIGDNSQDSDGYKAKNIVTALDTALREDFGRGVIEYATAPEAAEFGSLVQSAVARLNSYNDAAALKRYLGIARGAGLVELEELIHTRIKDLAWDARPKNSPTVTNQDNQFYSELRALVQFYERHVRYERAADVLAAEQRRDPYKNRFDYDTKIADEYRLAGNMQRELEALRKAYSAASGDLSASQSEWVERYLTLLYSTGAKSELQRIASLYNPHQLQLINFLIDKKEKLLALDAIERTRQSPAWIASRSGEVGLFLKDSSPEVEPLFKTALGWKQIGALLGRTAPAGRELIGDEWYLASRNYGYWLGMVGRENDSRRFIVGEIESHPADSRGQIELASYYLNNRNTARAAEHVQLAAERDPDLTTVKVLRGRVALANRDNQGALDAWNSILKPSSPPSDVEVYLKVMASNGFLRESLTPIGSYVTGYVNRAYRTGSGASQVEALKPLLREITQKGSARTGTDQRLADEVAAFFHSMVSGIPADSVVARTLIDEQLLSEVALAPVYRAIHQRLADSAARVFGTERYDSGYYDGNTWVYPARELADWRKKFIDYLIRQGSFDEARLLIGSIEREQREIQLARPPGSDSNPYSEDRYDWLPLASALIQLRSGRDPQTAIAELRRYAGIDARQEAGESVDDARIRQRALQAYALLVAERREADADTFLYEAYRTAVRGSGADDASFAGLAEIEARRGRPDEAARLLKMMAERSTDNLRALALAGETSARINRLDDALDYREQLSKANPNDTTNRLELARVLAANRRGQEAIDRLAGLIEERGSGNSVRAQAAEVVGEIVRADRALAARAAEVFGARSSDGSRLALSAAREASGDTNGAREILSRINTGSLAAIAQFKLGVLALSERRDSEAVSAFEKAVQLDSDARITDSIVFRAAGPRAQLVILYSRTGRDAAAFSLAEGDDSQRDSAVSIAVRTALGVRDDSSPVASYVFEPGLGEARAGGSAIKTLAELNQAAMTKSRTEILASLVESAVRLDRYDRAIALARTRSNEAARPEDKAALEKRLAEILAADHARRLRLAAQVRFDQTGATQSVYSARAAGD